MIYSLTLRNIKVGITSLKSEVNVFGLKMILFPITKRSSITLDQWKKRAFAS